MALAIAVNRKAYLSSQCKECARREVHERHEEAAAAAEAETEESPEPRAPTIFFSRTSRGGGCSARAASMLQVSRGQRVHLVEVS